MVKVRKETRVSQVMHAGNIEKIEKIEILRELPSFQPTARRKNISHRRLRQTWIVFDGKDEEPNGEKKVASLDLEMRG